jgi:hypothetical protein
MRRELHIYDFDGTIFRSPAPHPTLIAQNDRLTQPVFAGGLGWFQEEAGMLPPFVPELPPVDDTWYVMDTVRQFHKSISDGHHVIVLTGREHRQFERRVRQLLDNAGMKPHELALKPHPRGGTVAAKTEVMLRVAAKELPSHLLIIDDREEQGLKLQASVTDAVKKHFGSTAAPPVALLMVRDPELHLTRAL